MKKIAVFGNRNITNQEEVFSQFSKFLSEKDIEGSFVILHGGAAGPAKIMSDYADKEEDLASILFKPWTMVWSKLDFQPIFFYLRNKQVVENADYVLVITNNEKDSEVYRVIDLCERWDKDLTVLEV